ncbi:MAG: N-acetylmuramoyl-L-alanine amidase [Deltaproteobacteria bacterium]|nr:N-acetylmuramoyl-L-alanine amidase [Deltaproteobacteria bacterium]
MRTKSILRFASLITAVGLISCALPSHKPAFRADLRCLDLTPLTGRRIVIDPGHGGRFVGAVGARGMRESDINLAVALHLWGLLTQAGAEVSMTRTADVDLCASEKADLQNDLENRVKYSNERDAGIFVSIHHNSDTSNRKKNNTQIYYKLTDPGPSQDLAQSLAREMRNGNRVDDIFVYPGNYAVLRKATAVAVLGEASFISNPKNEKRLSFSNQLRKEAEDYFLGILGYLQKEIPRVVDMHPDGATIDDNAMPLIEAVLVGGSAGASINPETIVLYLDEQPVPFSFEAPTGRICYVPSMPLLNGWHEFSVEARNSNGNSLLKEPYHFCISLPPASIEVISSFTALPADGLAYSQIEVTARDYYGNPVIDGTRFFLETSAGKLSAKDIATAGGRAVTYFQAPDIPATALVTAHCQNLTGTATITCGPIEKAFARIRIVDAKDAPLDNVLVQQGSTTIGASDAQGFVFLSSETNQEMPLTFNRRGYSAQTQSVSFRIGFCQEKRITLLPQEDGVLLGRRFTLDPEPRDEATEKNFDLLADAEAANVIVAKRLQGLLEEAGALTTTTRSSLEQPYPALGDRILTGETFGGDYFLTITHRKGAPYVGHYFRSATGKNLAQHIAHSLSDNAKLKKTKVMDRADFTIIHPTAPALVINLGRTHLSKRIKNKDEVFEREAEAVYQGLLAFFRDNT